MARCIECGTLHGIRRYLKNRAPGETTSETKPSSQTQQKQTSTKGKTTPKAKPDQPGAKVNKSIYEQQTDNQLLKSRRAHEKLIREHKTKLENYSKNPDMYDNQGLLKNAKTPEIRQKIINERTHVIKKQIKGQNSRIEQINEELKRRGIL